MADAGRMINDCFRHQYPGLFKKPKEGDPFTQDNPEIPPEFPREASVTAEMVPDGFNREGYVWEELRELRALAHHYIRLSEGGNSLP